MKKPGKTLNDYSGFVGCRQGVIELTAVDVRFRDVRAEQGSFCERVGESAAARCFVWACQGSGQTEL